MKKNLRLSIVVLVFFNIAYFQECNQNNWQQFSPNLEYCNLENVNIAWTNLSGFNFLGANISNANLTGSDFTNANLTDVNFTNSDLTWCMFNEANLTNANLYATNLGATNFNNANLYGAILTGAIFFDTNFEGACILDVIGFPSSGYIGEPTLDCSFDSEPFCNLVSNYSESMFVTAVVQNNNNETITDQDDIIAAFNNNGECVGLAEAEPMPPFVDYDYAFGVYIYGLGSAEEIIFQFYDSSEDIIFDLVDTVNFIPNDVLGNIVQPLLFNILSSPSNAAPMAQDTNITMEEDTTMNAYLSANDEDGDALTFVISSVPENGTVTLSGTSATYTPNTNYNGNDSFTFYVNDGQENSNIASVSITITAVNDAPYILSIPDAEIGAGESYIYILESYDVDGDDLSYFINHIEGDGTATISDNILTVIGNIPNSVLTGSVGVTDGLATSFTSFSLTILDAQCTEEYNQGFWDGASTGDVNGDGILNVIDIVQSIDIILNQE